MVGVAVAGVTMWGAMRALAEVSPPQIEIQVRFVAFPRGHVEDLVRQAPNGVLDLRTLDGEFQKGKGELLYAPTVVVRSGEDGVVKDAREIIYPTDFTVSSIPDGDAVEGETKAGGVAATTVGAVVGPAGFVTREVGMILQVHAELMKDTGNIGVSLTPEIISIAGWQSHKIKYMDSAGNERKTAIEQPIFHAQILKTTVLVRNGSTVLAGGGIPDEAGDSKRMLFVFVTAKVLDAAGHASVKAPAVAPAESPQAPKAPGK